MQDQIALNRTFLHRTDLLAAAHGVNVQELPDILGVSRRTLFSARSDESTITSKTWLKLEAAEREAGIGEKAETPVSVPHPPPTPDLHEEIADLKERLGKIETLLERLLGHHPDNIIPGPWKIRVSQRKG